MGSNPYLLGQIGLVGNKANKPAVNVILSTESLPIRSNRISWKLLFPTHVIKVDDANTPLPIRSNRISWKRPVQDGLCQAAFSNTLPIRSNRISWKQFRNGIFWHITVLSLPIRSNRISWKLDIVVALFCNHRAKTLPIRSNRISWKLPARLPNPTPE